MTRSAAVLLLVTASSVVSTLLTVASALIFADTDAMLVSIRLGTACTAALAGIASLVHAASFLRDPGVEADVLPRARAMRGRRLP